MGVDAVGVAGLDVALRQREMSAGGDVDGVDGDAVGGGDGLTDSPSLCRPRHASYIRSILWGSILYSTGVGGVVKRP